MLRKLTIIFSFLIIYSCDLTTADEYNNEAIQLSKQNKYEDAIKLLDKAIKKKNNFRPALLNRGYYKSLSGDFNGAIKDYEKVLEFDPDNTFALSEIAFNWSSLNNPQKSINYYTKALKTEGAINSFLNSNGETFAINTNMEAKIFDNDADYNILDCKIYYNRGIEFIEIEEFDKAISDFNKSLNVNFAVSESYFFLGKAYLGKNNSIESCKNFTKSAELGDKDAIEMVKKYCNKKKIRE